MTRTTTTGTTTLALLAAVLAAGSAQAQTSPWTFRLGAAHVAFSESADVSVNGGLVAGANATATDNTTLGFELAYDVSPDWRVRFLAGIPPTTTLSGAGALAGAGTLGKVTYAPAALTATYSLSSTWPVRPYIGAGINYTIVLKSQDDFIANLDVKSAFGSVLHIGAEIPLDPVWSVSLDARKIFLKTKADGVLPAMGGAAAHADVTLNPLVILASVGRRF